METNNNQVSQPIVQSGTVDYAAALRQYNKYGRGRSMKKFCKLASEGQIEMSSKSGTDKRPGFIEVNPNVQQLPSTEKKPIENQWVGEENSYEIAGTRYKNEKLMSRMQKTDGTSRCFAQSENIKRHSLSMSLWGRRIS